MKFLFKQMSNQINIQFNSKKIREEKKVSILLFERESLLATIAIANLRSIQPKIPNTMIVCKL